MFIVSDTVQRVLHWAVVLVLTVFMWGQSYAQTPNLGRSVAPTELSEIDFTVMPDGRGLPPGAGSVQEGEPLYQAHCQSCHGDDGVGGINDQLVGGRGSLSSATPIKTVGSYWPYTTTLFDYVRRAMPYNAPGSLTNNEVYAVVAYLLYLNGIVDQARQLDAETLPRVEMPNAQGFDWAEYKWLHTKDGGIKGERHE